MLLTFDDGYFFLTIHETDHFAFASNERRWVYNHAVERFQTKNIKAASQFRQYADPRTENIFSKLMLKDYAVPRAIIPPAHLQLLPFQLERGIPHILSTNRTYLAHQPGLGKSAQFICAVNTKPGQALIICPSFLKTTWVREITKWSFGHFPCIDVIPDSENKFKMNWGADYIICSDAMLLKDWVREGLYQTPFRHIAIDEGHRFKEPSTGRTVALFGGQLVEKKRGMPDVVKLKSPGLIYRAEHVVALSGTPMLNKPIELWPVLFAMAPEIIDFMPYQDFGFRYCGAYQDDFGRWHFTGSQNEKELNNKIMGKFMQRIRKADVLADLPDKIRDVVLVDNDTRKKDVLALDKELCKKIDLGQIDKPQSLGDYATIRHENGLAKVKWAAQFVYDYLKNDDSEQIILFAHHRDVVEHLKRLLFFFNPLIINGGVTDSRRTFIEDQFQTGKCRLIIGNIDAMNLGLTLTAASRVVFAEYSWTPALNEQAEDRAHRIGQKDSVYVQYLVLPNSIDELVLNAILKKEESIRKVIDQ